MIAYLTPGCFDKGGISRYSRYQISALRELLGPDQVLVYSVLGPAEHDLETPFAVTWAAGGTSLRRKATFVARVSADVVRHRPSAIFAAHVNLSGLAVTLGRVVRARTVLNVYGLEVWSGLRTDAAWGLRSADLVISDCHNTAEYVKTAGLRAESAPTRILWDCVDTGRFYPGPAAAAVVERYGIPEPARHVNVLSLGRMSPDAAHKGYDRLLEAFAGAAARAPNLRLVYAGGGALVDVLRARARELGILGLVTFTGRVHEDHLADLYRSASVFSLVSDAGKGRGEGIPLTPLEAAACGTPILVGNQDGSREAAVDGVTGFVLDPFDRDAHVERLVRLSADGALRQGMGKAARERILAHHDYRGFRAQTAEHLRALGMPASPSAGR